MTKYLPYFLFVAAIAAAYLHSKSADPVVQHASAIAVVILLGGAGILWGVQDVCTGRSLVWRLRYASRADEPVFFWIFALVFRFAPGVVLLGVGIWFLVTFLLTGSMQAAA